jgi:hypothetical protein
MRMLNAALVRPDQPSFELRGHEVDAQHDLVSRIGAIAYNDADNQPPPTRCSHAAVGVDHRSRHNDVPDKRYQRLRRYVFDAPQADTTNAAPALFGRHHSDRLGFSSRPRLPCSALPTWVSSTSISEATPPPFDLLERFVPLATLGARNDDSNRSAPALGAISTPRRP